MIVRGMDPQDVRRVLSHPASMVGSDGWVLEPFGGAHPRNFATFVRTLTTAKGDDQLTDTVRRQTHAVARRFGLTHRGLVAPGQYADLVVLDPGELDEGGGFVDPLLPPRGVRHVFVNGTQVLPQAPAALPGRFLVTSSTQRKASRR
jgi:N-acyl-D-aspartate/D-glutamate deacylase